MAAFDSLPPEIARNRIFGTKEAARFIGLSPRTFRRLLCRGALPRAIKLSDRKHGFRIGDLMDFVDCRAAGREWKDRRGAADQAKAA